MDTPKHVSDFPADTQWVQLRKAAIAVMPNGRVFRMDKERVVELRAIEPHHKDETLDRY